MRIGVISDTHGLLRPEAVDALRGSELILHAGDIGKAEIIAELERLAPVIAVRGNVDTEKWTRRFHVTEVAETSGHSLYLLHNIGELDLNPAAAGFSAVIYGHSHQPKIEWKNGVLFFNPGSAGPRRFRLPITVGKIEVVDGELRPELTELTLKQGGLRSSAGGRGRC